MCGVVYTAQSGPVTVAAISTFLHYNHNSYLLCILLSLKYNNIQEHKDRHLDITDLFVSVFNCSEALYIVGLLSESLQAKSGVKIPKYDALIYEI